jgi:autophagy-related protein 2
MPKPLPIDMIDDDVPSNIEYLGSGPSHPQSRSSKARAKHDPTSNRHASSDLEQVISDIDGETIRLFNPKGLRILDGYYKTPRLRDDNEIR